MKKNKLIVVSLLFTFIAIQVAVAQDITILTSDEAEFKIPVNEANESKTLKNMLEDIGETEAEETIPLPDISKKVFEKVLPVLKAMSQAEEDAKAKAGYDIVKQVIQNETKGIEELKDFISALAYLDIPMAQPTSLKISDYAALYSLLTDVDQKTQEDILAAMDNNFFDFLAGLGTLSKVNEELEKKLGKRSESTWPTQEVNDVITKVAGLANTKLLINVATALNDDKLLNGAVRRFVWLTKNIPSYSNPDLFNKKLEVLAGQFSDPEKIKKLIKKHAIQKEYNIEKEFTLQDYIEKNGLQNLIDTIKETKILFLKDLGLTSLDGLEKLPTDSIEELNIDGGLLILFVAPDLPPLPNLKKLSLEGARLKEFVAEGLENLEELNLSKNQLENLDVSMLSKLKELNAEGNALITVEYNPDNLIKLNLAHNLLSGYFSGKGLSKLKSLRLSGNKFTSFDGTNLANLTNLEIRALPLREIGNLNVKSPKNLRVTIFLNRVSPYVADYFRTLRDQGANVE